MVLETWIYGTTELWIHGNVVLALGQPTGHSLYFHPIMETFTLTLLVQNQPHYDTVLLL